MPVPAAERKKGYSLFTWTMMMFSMNTCIPMFFLGPIGAGLGMDFWQVGAGALIGNLAAIIVMYLNGSVGVKYAIPFPVQLRESFGFRGMHPPVILRGFAGTMWFGIEAWAGSYALTLIVLYAIGTPNAATVAFGWPLVVALLFYVAMFILVMRLGLKGIGRMADLAGPLMLLYFIWLVYWLATTPQFAVNIPTLFVSSAGYFSMGFLLYLAVQTNWWATVALNISDLSRGMKPGKSGAFFWGLVIGVVICQLVGTWLGFASNVLTGTILPQQVIVTYLPQLGAIAPLVIVIGLLFAFLAPWSTDITANAPPLIDILMATIKLRWKTAVVIAGIIAFFAAPWWAVSAAADYTNYMTSWASNYGILLGPIAGIMVANFWYTRKRNYDLQKLYTFGPNGCWYKGGWSASSYLTLLVTWILCYGVAWATGQLAYFGGIPWPGGVIWYFAVVIAFIFKVLFDKMFNE